MFENIAIFAPLLGAIIIGLFTKQLSVRTSHYVTCGLMGLAALSAIILFNRYAINANTAVLDLFTFLNVSDLVVKWQLRFDSLSVVMILLVNSVSFLVHLYSISYMSHDKHQQRFFAYLSLFTFFMLMLVTSNNLAQLFLGWEGVGLASYLLIGFWYKKESANLASMKAFIVNRVGDVGLAIGIFACYLTFGSIEFDTIFKDVPAFLRDNVNFFGFSIPNIDLIAVALFIGAMGKSAQLGLHTWLPDAMEGPTPVSALIHAATMVTAGVFLLARMSPVFEYSAFAKDIIIVVGALTCIFAASIALTQNDIKRVIAYSTCSQLGYMFFACGVGAYPAAIFHLFTHGFFKALLFLGAGSVIHAVHDEQDMQKMGGLRKKIPFTYIIMLIGTLAITGVPLLSGFYSKDMILESAYAAHGLGEFAYILGIIAATFTAFYSWRLIFLTFHGEFRGDKETFEKAHEGPLVMKLPLALLSLGALLIGAIGYYFWGMVDADLLFWNGSIFMDSHGGHNILEDAHHVPTIVAKLPIIVGVVGLILAFFAYVKRAKIMDSLTRALQPIHEVLYNKYYVDELYETIFIKPCQWIANKFWKYGDEKGVDALIPNGAAAASGLFGKVYSKIQSGYVYHYAFAMLIGIAVILGYLIYIYKI